jgi:glycolate oxidase FAD binding subunit
VTLAVESIRAELASVVGESRVVSDDAACASAALDGITPASVIYPASAEQVAEALKYASDHGLAVIPFRNGTKLGVGNVPRRYDLALSLKDLNRIWHYEPGDLTVSVEPGMKLGDLQHFVARHRLWLPLDPPGGPRASIGGVLAANASGPLRLRYGTPRDMVLGMKIATTEGKLIKTGGRVVKNVAGYDLAKLLIGSYGTLGVIVEATFKLFPLPAESSTVVVSIGTLEVAREFRRRLLGSFLTPLRATLLNAVAGELVRDAWQPDGASQGFEMWIEIGGSTRVLERSTQGLEQLARASGASVQAIEASQARANWTRVADCGSWLPEVVPNPTMVRVQLPIAAGEVFVGRALEEAERRKIQLACFCQTNVGALSFCLIKTLTASVNLAVVNELRQIAQGLGGVLVVERCPVDLKSHLDVWGPAGDDFEVMRKVKAVWDPKGVLAPGRFVGGL